MKKIITLCLLAFIGTTTVNAQTNYAGSFDGSNSVAVVPHSSSIDLGSTFTIEAWIYTDNGWRTIIDKGDYDFDFAKSNNNDKLAFYNRNTGHWSYSNSSVSINTWTHVAITLSGGTLTFYINGTASGTASVATTQDSGPMAIGMQSPESCQCNLFNGEMDEMRLWNVARTQSEIQANMNKSISPSSTGLAAYYQFNEGSGNTLTDATSNGNNAFFSDGSYTNSGVSITTTPSCTPTVGTFVVNACTSYTWGAKGNKVYTASNNTDTIHLTNAGGCDSLVTLNLTIVASLPAITGASAVCIGSTTTLSNAIAGGIWSSIAGRAYVNASGIVTGTSGGTATIKYALSGCGSVTKTVTVNALPAIPTIGIVPGTPGITGIGGYCKNKTFSVVGKPTGGTWSSTGAFAITNLGVVTTDATPGAGSVSYAYINSNGCTSSRTIPANVVTCSSKGINNQMAVSNEQLVVYPNPAHSSINLNIKTLVGKGSIVVTDLYGKTVKQQTLSMGTNTIDVSSFAKGMYLVSVITEQGKQTQKVIVE